MSVHMFDTFTEFVPQTLSHPSGPKLFVLLCCAGHQVPPVYVDLLLSFPLGGERQPRVQPAVSGPVRCGQTER